MHNTVVVIGTRQHAMTNRPILHLKLGIPESGIFLPMESGIPVTFGIRDQSSTDKDWNPVPGIRNPRRGIQNPKLSGIPLYGAIIFSRTEIIIKKNIQKKNEANIHPSLV